MPDPRVIPQFRKATSIGLRSVKSFEREITSWSMNQINSSSTGGLYQKELAMIECIPRVFSSPTEYFSIFLFPLFEEVFAIFADRQTRENIAQGFLKAELVESGGRVQGFDSTLVSAEVKIASVESNDGNVDFKMKLSSFDSKKSTLALFDVVLEIH